MKAMMHDRYGDPEVVRLEDVLVPPIGDHDVLIETKAAGVNWADWSAVTGQPYLMRLGYGLTKPRHGHLGYDIAGFVADVGPKVTHFTVRDPVFGAGKGTFAEYAVAKEDELVAKPDRLTFEEAAAIPMAGLVALQALVDIAEVQHGHHVLVNGASGGIGTMAVQIAKIRGAEVTGVCSTANVELVSSLGADRVIDYTQTDFTAEDVIYDVILDIADTHTLDQRRRVLAKDGTLIPNSGRGGRWFGSVGRIVKGRLVSPFVSQRIRPFLSLARQDDLVLLAQLAASGELRPVVGRSYSLIEVPDAIAHVGAGHVRGKTVITV